MRCIWVIFTSLGLVACGESTQRVGREFHSMQQCLAFIEQDVRESLVTQTDTLQNVSGKTAETGKFFRCELKETGSRGRFVEGRWDRAK